MKIELKKTPAYLLREGNLEGSPVICDVDEMLRTLAASIRNDSGPPCNVVCVLGASLRWRILPKKEVRDLAQDAFVERAAILLDEYTTIVNHFNS
jgi:hypothetical protein